MLYAKQFYAAWKFVPFLLISSVLNCVSGILGPILAAKKDSKAMAKSAVYGASVNLILNILFVYFIGAQGVTVATVIASYVIYQIRKVAVGKDIIIENYRYVIITWILLCIQASTEIYTDFWYVEILLMIVMFFLNYSNIRKIFYVLIKRKRREMR
jgi:O-antigen/teichoic acid export membrane protein